MNRSAHGVILLFLFLAGNLFAADVGKYAEIIAPLIDPAKLATLGERVANPRIQKTVYWLAVAKGEGLAPQDVLTAAIGKTSETNTLRIALTRSALLRNLSIAEKLGCLNRAGMDEMRQGKSPAVQIGPFKGDELSVDHIIPRAVCPELDNVIANLELLPLRLNQRKNSNVGQRQTALAEQFHRAGMMSSQRLRQIRELAAKQAAKQNRNAQR